MPHLGIASKHFVIGRKLLIDLGVESRAIRPIIGRSDQVVCRPKTKVEGVLLVILRCIWVVAEEVFNGGIEARCRNLIIREWRAIPAIGSRRLAQCVWTECRSCGI